MIRAVVFDLDNTLVDFMHMKQQSVDASILAMIDAGLQATTEEVKVRIDDIYKEQGIEYQKVFDVLLTRMLGRVDYKILAAGITAYRRSREAALVPYAHVQMTILKLARMGLMLGVVSDAPPLEAWLRLCALNMQHVFDAVVTFEDTGERKPSPAPFLKVLSLLEVAAEDALMVGDWEERDIYGGARVGMRTAFARYGDCFGTQESQADYDLQDISELIAIVESVNGRSR